MRMKWTADGWVIVTARASNGRTVEVRFENFRWPQVAVNVMANIRYFQLTNK